MKAPWPFFQDNTLGVVISTADDERMCDPHGRALLEGASVKIASLDDEQPVLSKPPVEMATLAVVRQRLDGSKGSYTVKIPSERLENDFDGVIREAVPEARFDNTSGRLFAAILARSIKEHEDRMPTRTTERWMTEDGWYWKGKRLSDAPIEIVAEACDEFTGETVYRLRTPRKDGTGYEYVNTNWDGLNSGLFRQSLSRAFNVFDPVKLSVAMREHFNALSEADRNGLVMEEYAQQKREMEVRLSRRLHIPGR